jgi:hypothetical protein
VHMDTGCTRLMAVVLAIFSQGGWWHIDRIGDALGHFVLFISLAHLCSHFE